MYCCIQYVYNCIMCYVYNIYIIHNYVLCIIATMYYAMYYAIYLVLCHENPHGQRCLVGYSPWGCKESDTTK